MNILLVHPVTQLNENEVTFGAVEYYRMHSPHVVLSEMCPEYTYTTVTSVLTLSDEDLKKFDFILFSRVINRPEETRERLNKLGIIFALDLDDYWHLYNGHLLESHYKEYNVTGLIAKSISVAHFVICTTDILASKIKPLNKRVHVIPNGIDTNEEQWKVNRTFSDRIRFGFTQGDTHIKDVMLISSQVAKSLHESKFYHKAQVVLCGYKGNQTVSVGYEKILTDSLKPLKFHPEYQLHLMNMGKDSPTDKPYRRIWAKDVSEFGSVYDDFDISVVPLEENEFNSCKSNIKMLEAGFKGCAVMVSDVAPYYPFATSENSFLLSEKTFMGWQRYILDNPEIIKEKAHYLKRDVAKYSLKNISKLRHEIYKTCLK